MQRFARMVGAVVAEIIQIPDDEQLEDLLHPVVVAECRPAGPDVAPGWVLEGDDLVAPPPPPPAPPIRRIAPLAFRRRLAPADRAAITLAAAQALSQGDATLQVFLDDLAAARFVDLDDEATEAGVAAMLAAELISQQQADALLTDGTVAETA